MNLIFANAAGWWALLGIPAVLLIHFLQERSRRVKVSTLFLLERVAPESVGGARLEKLRNSLALWLQLLAVLVVTWMLCEPRWIKEDSRQTMVVVLDSSVSMSAFKRQTRDALERSLPKWSQSAANTDWHLLETDVRRRTLYAGEDWREMLRAFDGWEPLKGTHEVDEALLAARQLVKNAGMVVLVTDHEARVSSDVATLSVADRLDNVGFTGAEVKAEDGGRMRWEALVKNHGEQAATRNWWVERDGLNTWERRELRLLPGQTVVLSGELPPGERRMWLRIDGDAFQWDDGLPLQLPVERVMKVDFQLANREGEVLRKMVESLPQIQWGQGAEALQVLALGSIVEGSAIQMMTADGEQTAPLDGAFVVADDHALTRGLNWMGLLTSKPRDLTITAADEPLLWKGDRVLAFLRHETAEDGRRWKKLVLNWEVAGSNAARHPAMLVLLHRFVEDLRKEMKTPWAGNFECAQDLEMAGPWTGWQLKGVEGEAEAFAGRAPDRVGFFEVANGDKEALALLQGAARFADTREADFSNAKPVDTTEQRQRETALKQSEADPWTPLWMLLVVGCLLGAWAKKG